MPVLASRALPIPYLGGGGSVLALAGAGHMDTLVGVMVGAAVGVLAGVAASAGAGLHPTGTPGGKSKIGFLRR